MKTKKSVSANVATDSTATPAASKPVRISLQPATPEVTRSVMQEIEAEGLVGLEVSGDSFGVLLKFPGHGLRTFSREDLIGIHEVVLRPVVQGSTPAAVFERTFSQEADGSFVAQFSDEKRARSLEMPANERGQFSQWIAGLIGRWSDFENVFAAKQAEAAAAATPAVSAPVVSENSVAQ